MAIFIRYQFVFRLGIWFHGSLFQIEWFFHLKKAQHKRDTHTKKQQKKLVHSLACTHALADRQHKLTTLLRPGFCAVLSLSNTADRRTRVCQNSVSAFTVDYTMPCSDLFLSLALSGVSVNWWGSPYITAINQHICSCVQGPTDNTAGKLDFLWWLSDVQYKLTALCWLGFKPPVLIAQITALDALIRLEEATASMDTVQTPRPRSHLSLCHTVEYSYRVRL